MTQGKTRFFDGKHKQCGNCFEVKTVDNFHRVKPNVPLKGLSSDYRWQCKPCRRDMLLRWQREQAMKRYPGKFWECDNCDEIMPESKTKCRKCGESEKLKT